MREIKFRAWDRTNNCMIYPQTGMTNHCESWELLQRFDIIMQYTGLKDKNDKEIYEGDIMEEDYSKRTVIEFGFHETSTDYYSSPAYGFYGITKDRYNWTFSLDIVSEGEIIGNIWENSKLLIQENQHEETNT